MVFIGGSTSSGFFFSYEMIAWVMEFLTSHYLSWYYGIGIGMFAHNF